MKWHLVDSLRFQATIKTFFMQEDVNRNDVFIRFQRTATDHFFKTMEMAELGYDSKRRFKLQVNLLYIDSLSSDACAPVYYKQFLGSTPDVSTFTDLLNEWGTSSKKYTVIVDQGFAAEEQF